MEFARVNEVQAFGTDVEWLHIDLQAKFTAGKIQYFDFIMPVMLEKYAFAGRTSLVNGAGKGFGAVGADFFQS